MESLTPLLLELILPLALLAGLVLLAGLALVAGFAQAAAARWISGAAARRARRLTLGIATALALAPLLAQTLFFDPIVRRLAAAARERTGIAIDFARASGNLVAGRVILHDATLRRAADPAATFDLRVRELEIDVRLLGLLGSAVEAESVRVAGLRGTYVRTDGVDRPPRKPFHADVLLLEDLELTWTLKRAGRPDFALPLRIDRLEASPFEARDAAFAVLFQSTAKGSLGGGPFSLERGAWKADGIPIRLLGDFLGAPFDWLREGRIDLRSASFLRGEEVELSWTVLLRKPQAAVPERVTGLQRRVAEAVVGFINRQPRDIPLSFTLTLKEEGFRGRMSLEALEFWDAIAGALVAELAEFSGLPPDVLRDWGRAGLEKLKGFLRRKSGN